MILRWTAAGVLEAAPASLPQSRRLWSDTSVDRSAARSWCRDLTAPPALRLREKDRLAVPKDGI